MATETIERPQVRARVKYVGRSAYKVRHVVNLIRGKQAEDAQNILLLCNRGAADEVGKLLNSAIANAEHNNHIPAEELKVSQAFVDEGPTAKRFRPRARGRGNRIFKRSSHITIVLERMDAQEIELKAQKDSESGAANAREQRRRRTAASKAAAKAKQEAENDSEDSSSSLSVSDPSDPANVRSDENTSESVETSKDKAEAKEEKKPAAKKASTKKSEAEAKPAAAKKASSKVSKTASKEASGAIEETTGSESAEGREAADDEAASKPKAKKSTKEEGDA